MAVFVPCALVLAINYNGLEQAPELAGYVFGPLRLDFKDLLAGSAFPSWLLIGCYFAAILGLVATTGGSFGAGEHDR